MKNSILFILAISFLALSSCKKDTADIKMDAAIQHIPSDVSSVTIIRVPQILKKIDFEEIKKMDFYQEMVREASQDEPLAGKILNDPSQSGVNLEQNFYSIAEVNPDNPNDMMTAVMFNIADKTKFEEVLKSADMSAAPKKMSGYQYTSSYGTFMAWNDELAVVGQAGRGNPENKLDRIYNLGEGSSILSANNFGEVGGSSDDISSWLSSDAIAQSRELAQGAAFLGWNKSNLEGNYILGGINFEDKKMVGKSKFILDKVVGNDLKMPFKSSIGTDFSPYIPGENLTGVMTFGLDTKGIVQLLKEKNVLALLESQMGLDRMGLSVNDIVNAIDGDMMFALQSAGSDGKPAGVFSMKIDEKAFAPFLNMITGAGMLSAAGDGVYKLNDQNAAREFHDALGGQGEPNEVMVAIKNNMLFVTADPGILKGIADGGLAKGSRIDGSVYKSISKGFLGAKGFPDQLKALAQDMGMEDNMIESFVFSSNHDDSYFEVVSKKDGNFLKSLIQSADIK